MVAEFGLSTRGDAAAATAVTTTVIVTGATAVPVLARVKVPVAEVVPDVVTPEHALAFCAPITEIEIVAGAPDAGAVPALAVNAFSQLPLNALTVNGVPTEANVDVTDNVCAPLG